MFSSLRPSLVYTVNRDIADHDENVDATEWSYDGLTVWKGSLDVTFREHNIDVFWLYNDTSECIGLAEHESEDHSIFKTLLYRDNAFSTLFQEEWTANGTLWSKITSQAYQDLVELPIEEVALRSNILTPNLVISRPDVYVCKCGKRSFKPECKEIKKEPFGPIVNPIFVDDYVVYTPPANSACFKLLGVACETQLHLQCESSQEHPEYSDSQAHHPELPQEHSREFQEPPP
jgi:hypothetical protein